MKSVNVKKIAAVAAGAAMVGAAFAGAVAVDSTGLGNYKFFSGNEPNVKIVVGSQADAADGVAAGNIAAMVGNLAYQSTDVYVTGTDQLSCGTSTGSGSSVQNGMCVADVTTPGVNTATAYLMKTYVEDRMDNQADSTRGAAPNYGNVFSGPATRTTNAKLVTQDMTNVLAMPNGGLVSNGKNLQVKQEQKVYLGALTEYDTTAKVVQAKQVRTIYETTFSNPLPACWDTTKTYANCATTSDQLDRTHTKINFLGDQWVVVSFTLSGGKFTGIKLGKETAYKPFMNIGEEITAPNGVKAKLTDITAFAFGTLNQPKTTFDIFDANGQNIGTAILMPGEEYNQNGIYLHLYNAVTGVTGTSYAEISMFSDVIELTHGGQISGHGNWKAYLNGDTNTAYTYGTTEGLQAITLFDDISTNTLNTGDAVNLITNAPGFKLNFLGLETVDYDPLTFTVQKSNQITLGPSTYLTADLMQISSGRTNAFQFESSAVSDGYIYALINATAAPSTNVSYGTFWSILNATETVAWNSTGLGMAATGATSQTTAGVYDTAIAIDCNQTLGTLAGNDTLFTITYTDVAGTSRTGTIMLTGANTSAASSMVNGVRNITAVTTNRTAAQLTNVYCGIKSYYIPSGTAFYYKNADSTSPYHVANAVNWPLNGTMRTEGNMTQYWYSTTESAMLAWQSNNLNRIEWAIPELTEDNTGLIAGVGYNRYWGLLYDTNLQQFVNALGSTTIDKAAYEVTAGTLLGASTATAPNQLGTYVSFRGSVLNSVGSTSMGIGYATKIAHAQYTLTSGASNSSGMTSSVTAGKNDFLLNQDGYIVQVTDVTGTCGSGSCTGSGSVSGIENLGVSQATAYSLLPLDTSASPLVVLDSSPLASSSQVIAVGGPLVNTVAAQAGVTIDASTEPMVKVVGSKIVVAGYSAADTTAAANSLIQWLAQNRDTLQR